MTAMKELRKAVGMTQIQFAVKIKKSYPTVQRYEGNTPPKGQDLIQFLEMARECKRLDLAKIFKQAAVESIPGDLLRLIHEKGPEDEYVETRKETAQQSAVHKRKVRS